MRVSYKYNVQSDPKINGNVMTYRLDVEEKRLWEQITQLRHYKQLDPTLLALFKQKVRRFLHLDAYYSYLALGTLASLEGDIKAIHAYHQTAMETYSRKPDILANYAHCLVQVNAFSQAAELMLEAYYVAPAEFVYLEEAVFLCGIMGRFHLIAELHHIHREQLTVFPQFFEIAPQIVDFMNRYSITDEDMENHIDQVFNILKSYQISINPQQIAIHYLNQEIQYQIQLKEISL